MITSHLHHTATTTLLDREPALAEALAWVRAHAATAGPGIVELQGRQMYAIFHDLKTLPRNECAWESHRHTADVQVCIGGGEYIDWTGHAASVPAESYDADRDFEIWPKAITPAATLRLSAGDFVIFLPGELHRPMIADERHSNVRKLVVKIDASLLSCCSP